MFTHNLGHARHGRALACPRRNRCHTYHITVILYFVVICIDMHSTAPRPKQAKVSVHPHTCNGHSNLLRLCSCTAHRSTFCCCWFVRRSILACNMKFRSSRNSRILPLGSKSHTGHRRRLTRIKGWDCQPYPGWVFHFAGSSMTRSTKPVLSSNSISTIRR